LNALERLNRRVRGEAVDRQPNCNIFMTFAARYSGNRLADYYQDHRVLVEANMAVLEGFDLEIVQAISDPYREAADFGLEVEFPTDGLPLSKKPLLAEPEDIHKLQPVDPARGRRMSDRLAAVRLFREQVGGEVPIMGWVEGALAEAVDLRGMNDLFMDLVLRPDWVEEVLEICVVQGIRFARAQVEAGADIIGLGDAAASQVSPRMYRQFALPYEKRIFDAVHEMGALARLHICGDSSRIVDEMVETGADIIDLDWMVDLKGAGEKYGHRVSLLGNYDPVAVLLQGSPDEVYQATLACGRDGGSRCISAAGCEVPVDTPHENLHAHARALRDLG
jgi:uroporphyrinogen decarboxylase